MASVLALAARQGGVVTTAQAIEHGVAGTTLRGRAARDGWVRLHRGVWLVAGHTPSARSTALAAALALGEGATLTGGAALAAHRVRDRFPEVPTVVVGRGRARAGRRDGIDVVTTRWPPRVRRVDGLPVVGVHDALLRCAIDGEPAGALRDDVVVAVQRGALPRTTERLPLPRGARGAPRLRRIHREACARGADSPLTLRVVDELLRGGVQVDPTPVPVHVRGRTLHPDVTLLGRCVAIECDGLTHHHTQAQLATDHRKDRAYAGAGWQVARVGWHELERDWTTVLADLRELAARARLRPIA